MPSNKTPFELFYGRKPDLSNLKVFGCSAFRFVEVGVKKLDSKAIKEIFVRYGRTHDSNFLYNPVTGKMHLSLLKRNSPVLIRWKSEIVNFYLNLEHFWIFPTKKNDTCSKSVPPSVEDLTPEKPSSSTNQDLNSNFKTRSGRLVKHVQRFGCPIDSSVSVSFVECFACEEVPWELWEVPWDLGTW